jgi:hypothetical protein
MKPQIKILGRCKERSAIGLTSNEWFNVYYAININNNVIGYVFFNGKKMDVTPNLLK